MSTYLTTSKLAERFGVKPETVRRGLCMDGHYLGLKPTKLPNGRLLWPDVNPEDVCNSYSNAN